MRSSIFQHTADIFVQKRSKKNIKRHTFDWKLDVFQVSQMINVRKQSNFNAEASSKAFANKILPLEMNFGISLHKASDASHFSCLPSSSLIGLGQIKEYGDYVKGYYSM